MSRKVPTVKEIFEMARQAGYDSFGLVWDLELIETLEKLYPSLKTANPPPLG